MEPFFVIALLAALAAAAVLAHLAAAKRRKELAQLASRIGFRYAAQDLFGVSARYEGRFPTLQKGHERYAYNVLAGEHAKRPAFLFDHHHETYSTDSKGRRRTQHHHRSFVLLEHDTDLGRIEARPEGLFDKVAGFFGFDDIDFESEEFSRRYHVKAEERKLAYDVFHAEMIEFFLAAKDLKLTTSGSAALLRRGEGRMSVAEIERTLGEGIDFLGLLPRYLRKDRAAGGAP
ncbi:MAG: hypothetical protein ACREID_01905 [Planctomycetota bacterium]